MPGGPQFVFDHWSFIPRVIEEDPILSEQSTEQDTEEFDVTEEEFMDPDEAAGDLTVDDAETDGVEAD